MRNYLKYLAVGSLLLLGATACADLEITNQNEPDAARSLVTAGDILSLISGSFAQWHYGNYDYNSGSMALSNAAFQHNAPWANCGMEKYGRLPRIAFINTIADADYAYMTRSWFYNYKAISAVSDGLRGLEDPEVQADLTADEISMARAFGKFVLGISHASLAVFYEAAFIVDDATPLIDQGGVMVPDPGPPVTYEEMMTAALGYFDDAIAIANAADWTMPEDWMAAELTGPELAQVAHSMKARYRAANARTSAERQAVNWDAVVADIEAGITEDYVAYYDRGGPWDMDIVYYGALPYWSQMAYFVYGMADQSGDFQEWNALSLGSKNYNKANGDPFLIVTPDLRYAQGTSVAEQRLAEGRYFRVNRPGVETGYTWKRPDRGTWRWSWYKHTRGQEYWEFRSYSQAEIRMEEMNHLKAEALYYDGEYAAVADIINDTRVYNGLNATDAAGTNTSCVPKLPDGTCGDLFEMLKWEKRMENTFRGPQGNTWYYDARGWGDLWAGTFLHLPMPCGEAQVLNLLPCTTNGGSEGMFASLSTYAWNGEG